MEKKKEMIFFFDNFMINYACRISVQKNKKNKKKVLKE